MGLGYVKMGERAKSRFSAQVSWRILLPFSELGQVGEAQTTLTGEEIELAWSLLFPPLPPTLGR